MCPESFQFRNEDANTAFIAGGINLATLKLSTKLHSHTKYFDLDIDTFFLGDPDKDSIENLIEKSIKNRIKSNKYHVFMDESKVDSFIDKAEFILEKEDTSLKDTILSFYVPFAKTESDKEIIQNLINEYIEDLEDYVFFDYYEEFDIDDISYSLKSDILSCYYFLVLSAYVIVYKGVALLVMFGTTE